MESGQLRASDQKRLPFGIYEPVACDMKRPGRGGGQLLLGKRPVKACAGKLQRDAHDLQRQYAAEHGGCDAGSLGPPSPQRGYVTS